jgi:hypothetical protein
MVSDPGLRFRYRAKLAILENGCEEREVISYSLAAVGSKVVKWRKCMGIEPMH